MNNNELITQGKYKGKHPNDVEDLQYLKWMVSTEQGGRFFGRKASELAKEKIKAIEYYGK